MTLTHLRELAEKLPGRELEDLLKCVLVWKIPDELKLKLEEVIGDLEDDEDKP